MIFEGRTLDEISDDEIASLVEDHVSERQHLEFKATLDYKEETVRQELLRDVVSMANGGGGYLIIGVRDDGRGRAQCFVEPAQMSKSDSMAKSIRSLCHDHIAERIEGIEIRSRKAHGNSVIIVHVPPSGRRPHMVTRNHRTEFLTRVEDGKREMSMAEIREAFVSEPTAMRLKSIDAKLSDLVRILTHDQQEEEFAEVSQTHVSDSLLEDGRLLARVRRQHFAKNVGETPFLWLASTPVEPRRRLIDVEAPDIVSTLSAPPGSRQDGWNMAGLDNVQKTMMGIKVGTKAYRYLEVFENGHLEFWTPLDEHFCWRQSAEEQKIRPRLYPFPVVEYPVTFLRLVATLLSTADYSAGVLIQLQYRNVAGYILRPGQPGSIGFEFPITSSEPFLEPHIEIGPTEFSGSLDPDEVALDILTTVYGAFGLRAKHIPFQVSDGTFSFGS